MFKVLFYYYNLNKWFSSKKKQEEDNIILENQNNIEWKIATSPSFSQVAVLKTDEVYIRSTENNFQSSNLVNIGKTTIKFPENLKMNQNQVLKTPEKWRQIVWSLDEQVIVVLCGSAGPILVISVLESEILQIINPEDYSLHNGVSSIQFRDENKNMNGWELLMLGLDGFLSRIKISFDGMNIEQIYHDEGLFYAGKLHSRTTCMNYDISSSKLIIGGGSLKSPSKNDDNLYLSLSVWELLDESPFHRLISSTSSHGTKKSFKRNRTFLRTMKHMYRSAAKRFVLQKVSKNFNQKKKE